MVFGEYACVFCVFTTSYFLFQLPATLIVAFSMCLISLLLPGGNLYFYSKRPE